MTPLDAGLGFAVCRDKDFIGREALARLEDRPPKQRLATLVLDDPDTVPLGGEPVRLGDRIIGKTTSAAFGYRIGQPVALAMIEPDVFAGDPSSSSRSGARSDSLAVIDPEAFAGDPEPRADVDVAGKRASGIVTFEAAFDPAGARMLCNPSQASGFKMPPDYAQSSACAPESMETRAQALRKPVIPHHPRESGEKAGTQGP